MQCPKTPAGLKHRSLLWLPFKQTLISHKAVASAWRNWHKQLRALVEALQAWQTHRTAMVDEWRYPPRILSRWSHQLHEHCLFWQQLNNIPKYLKDACDMKHKVDQAMTLSSIEQAARASQRAIFNWFWDQQSIDINRYQLDINSSHVILMSWCHDVILSVHSPNPKSLKSGAPKMRHQERQIDRAVQNCAKAKPSISEERGTKKSIMWYHGISFLIQPMEPLSLIFVSRMSGLFVQETLGSACIKSTSLLVTSNHLNSNQQ